MYNSEHRNTVAYVVIYVLVNHHYRQPLKLTVFQNYNVAEKEEHLCLLKVDCGLGCFLAAR